MQNKFLYKKQATIFVVLVLSLIGSISISNGEEKTIRPFSFLALSDMPYSSKENYVLKQRTRPAVKNSPLPFVIFMGDFKNSTLPCSAALLTERLDQIMALHPGRVFYTPGDNDWTDCDRTEIIQRFSELDRLDLLRRLFYDTPMSLPPEWLYARQPLFPENMRWVYNNTLFATVHLVSTNNGREELRQECGAFASFNLHLRYLSEKFKKPILLMHGDINPYCLDRGFGGVGTPNLWRFNSTGDYGLIDAAVITVDPSNIPALFYFTSLTENKPPEHSC